MEMLQQWRMNMAQKVKVPSSPADAVKQLVDAYKSGKARERDMFGPKKK